MDRAATEGSASFDFAQVLLRWQRLHGRTGLPWQGTQDPYRVWLSEIMLQQTQVSTVRAYFERFVARFPDVAALAAASQDEVFAHWAGLGYYSRARNLHACAKELVAHWGGAFPRTALQLQSLPGIGPSTAAAIASFCWGERVAILDGNVKRVLARVFGFEHDLAQARHAQALHAMATELLPQRDSQKSMPRYTQAIMDLGATVCTPRQPQCNACPMRAHCVAHAQGRVAEFPVKTKKLRRSSESLWLLWAQRSDGLSLLAKRPAKGIWAGLHCLPVFESPEALEAALKPSDRKRLVASEPFVHVLTHKDLHLHVMRADLPAGREYPELGNWLPAASVGLPAPVRKLLTPE
jgi:A/G-specific adenine glycosylase